MDGIVFRTTDPDRWGAGGGLGTGGNLTPLQFDEDMWNLLTRIQQLEQHPPTAVSISNVTVIGSQFELNMSDGSTLGPYDLPVATLQLLGQWVNDMLYRKLDFVTVPHLGLYMCQIQHTSPAAPATFDPNAVDEDSGSPTFGQKLWMLVFGEDVYIYDVGFMMPGRPGQGITVGDTMFSHVFCRPVSVDVNMAGSVAVLDDVPTAAMSFDIKLNTTTIGTLDFAIGVAEGTFTIAAQHDAEIGDRIRIMAPSAVDASAKGLATTLRFTRTDIS